MIPADDRGFTLGDGLFETLLAEAGDLKALDAHLARMTAGCAVLGLPAPDAEEARRLMRQALTEAGLTQARAAVRLTLTAGSGGRGLDRPTPIRPVLVATAAPSPLITTPARLVTATVRRNDRSPASRLKTLAYLDNVLARAEAVAAGGDEAVMLNTVDEAACAAAANLFWTREGRVFTPALACGVLPGIVRGQLMDRLGAVETRAGLADLAAADAIILTNSLIGVRGVCSLDGRRLESEPWAEAVAAVLRNGSAEVG